MSTENKKITLSEFKSWIDGVEDMMVDGWIPDARQWERIRSKINDIEEKSVVIRQEQPTPVVKIDPPPLQYATYPSGPVSPPPSNFQQPAYPSGNPPLSHNAQIPVRTPDIDTSSGGYASSFA